jgi:hypothetical protein
MKTTPHRGFMPAALAGAALLLAACASAPPTAAPTAAPAPTAASPATGSAQSILWVGNSFFYYNNSLHGHFGQLANSGSTRTRSTSVTVSGSGLDWHDLPSLLREGGLGRYSFVGDNEIRFNPPGRQYDTVVMMDCSQCPVHPQLVGAFNDSVRKNAAIAKQHGIRPVLFMSWAYKDKPEMTQQLADAYTAAGKANGAQVIPVGLAFARAIALKPDIELYVADKRHPSLAGTYLAAATSYAAFYGKSPVGLSYTAGLPVDTVRVLQTAAWETVQAYKP